MSTTATVSASSGRSRPEILAELSSTAQQISSLEKAESPLGVFFATGLPYVPLAFLPGLLFLFGPWALGMVALASAVCALPLLRLVVRHMRTERLKARKETLQQYLMVTSGAAARHLGQA